MALLPRDITSWLVLFLYDLLHECGTTTANAVFLAFDVHGTAAHSPTSTTTPPHTHTPTYAVTYDYDPVGRFATITSSVASVQSVVAYSYLQGLDLITGRSSSDGNAHPFFNRDRYRDRGSKYLAKVPSARSRGNGRLCCWEYCNEPTCVILSLSVASVIWVFVVCHIRISIGSGNTECL